MQPVRVAIMDVNDLSRLGLQALVEKMTPPAKFVGAFATLQALDECLHEREIDVLLLDDLLPQTLSIGFVVDHLRAIQPSLQIILLSYKLNVVYIQNVLQREVSGYIYKEDRLADILGHAMHLVRRGQLYLSPQVSVLPYTGIYVHAHQKLNARDLSVLHLMHSGKTVQEIAAQLEVNDRAIYGSQSKLRRALGVPTTELIVAVAAKKGWLKDIETR